MTGERAGSLTLEHGKQYRRKTAPGQLSIQNSPGIPSFFEIRGPMPECEAECVSLPHESLAPPLA